MRPEIRRWLELDTWQREQLEPGRRERESDLVKLGGFRVQIERWPEWTGKNPAGQEEVAGGAGLAASRTML